jgi:hypothetical protein
MSRLVRVGSLDFKRLLLTARNSPGVSNYPVLLHSITDWSASPTANHRTPPSKARHYHYLVERRAQVQIFINRQHMPARLNCRWYPVVF